MKKTLFAMAALALCGTAVAGEYEDDAHNYVGKNFNRNIYGQGSDVVFNVDQTVTLNAFDVYDASSVTLNFVGANTFSTSVTLDLKVGEGDGTLAITGDNDAKIHWGESLTSSAGEVKTLTLVSTTATGYFSPTTYATFEGLTESGSITLGNATVDYVGYHKVTTAAEAEALIKGDNQIALVAIKDTIIGTKQLALVGKITPAAPEPATATLSLMALAGLCARRRRH